jgi:anti-anti-sigma regulatory factor
MRTQTAKRRRNRTAQDVAAAKRSAQRLTLAVDETDPIALKQRLEAAVNEGRDLEIDAGAVVALTTGGIQVLLAAAADAAARHLQFRLTACGSSIIDAFAELGLSDMIETWLDPAGSGCAGGVTEA